MRGVALRKEEFEIAAERPLRLIEGGKGSCEESSFLPTKEVLYLGIFLAFLQAIDGILTGIGVGRFGVAVEGNPVLRNLMIQFGHIEILTFIKVSAIVIVLHLMFLTKKIPWVKNAMGALTGVYLFAAVLPWTYILFIKPLI